MGSAWCPPIRLSSRALDDSLCAGVRNTRLKFNCLFKSLRGNIRVGLDYCIRRRGSEFCNTSTPWRPFQRAVHMLSHCAGHLPLIVSTTGLLACSNSESAAAMYPSNRITRMARASEAWRPPPRSTYHPRPSSNSCLFTAVVNSWRDWKNCPSAKWGALRAGLAIVSPLLSITISFLVS